MNKLVILISVNIFVLTP